METCHYLLSWKGSRKKPNTRHGTISAAVPSAGPSGDSAPADQGDGDMEGADNPDAPPRILPTEHQGEPDAPPPLPKANTAYIVKPLHYMLL